MGERDCSTASRAGTHVPSGRWRALLLALLVAATLLAPASPASQAATETSEPFIHTPAPAPGALVPAGPVELGAHLWTPEDVETVEIRLDGTAVADVRREPADPDQGTPVAAPVELDAGTREITVRFTDSAGREATRRWQVTATERRVERLAGDGRAATAAAIAEATYPDGGAQAAVLARADAFADALAGAPLAVAVDGPLLLSGRDALPEATAAALGRLAPDARVHLLGGQAALSAAVREAVEDLGLRTVRHAGGDRFATAAAIAQVLPRADEVVVASGARFPDALAASAPAARDGQPVLLVGAERLPEATAEALADLAPSRATIVGGSAAVSPAVAERIGEHAGEVARVAGGDRFATAAAVLEEFFVQPRAISLASGTDFPDALAGARHAAGKGQPLLLTGSETLPAATAEQVFVHQPVHIDLYGGSAAVRTAVAEDALQAAEDGPHAPRVTAAPPETVPSLWQVRIATDRAVDPDRSSVHVELAGTELAGSVAAAPDGLVFAADPEPQIPVETAYPVRVTARLEDSAGHRAHYTDTLTYLRPDPHFAVAGPVTLHLPSPHVELIGFHQARHHGAQQQQPHETSTPKTTLPSRQRGTGSRTAADVVAHPEREVLAPVTGEVVRAGSYVLYCDHTDHFVVIEPDARPGWEVKVLHFRGLQVGVGDRVVAQETVIGTGPRQLPFRSQVDDHSRERDWPHLHVEVVDPSVPTPPGSGC